MRGNPIDVELFHTPNHIKKQSVDYRFIATLTSFATKHYDITYYIRRGSNRLSGIQIVLAQPPTNLYFLAELVIYYQSARKKLYLIINDYNLYYVLDGNGNDVYLCSVIRLNGVIRIVFYRNIIPHVYSDSSLLLDLDRVEIRVLLSNHLIRSITGVDSVHSGLRAYLSTNEPIVVNTYSSPNTFTSSISFILDHTQSSYIQGMHPIELSSCSGERFLYFKWLPTDANSENILLYFDRYSVGVSNSWAFRYGTGTALGVYLKYVNTPESLFLVNDDLYIAQNCVLEYVAANRHQRQKLRPDEVYDFTCVVDVNYYVDVEANLGLTTSHNNIMTHYTDPIIFNESISLQSRYASCVYRGKYTDTPYGVKSTLSSNIRELEYEEIPASGLLSLYSTRRERESYAVLVPDYIKYLPDFTINTSV